MNGQARPSYPWSVLVVALTLPSLVTWVYFVWLRAAPATWQQGAYAVGKSVQFALPAVWCLLVLRERLSRPKVDGRALVWGLGFGGVVALAMGGVYYGLLASSAIFAEPTRLIQAKIQGLGITTPAKFLALGVFYALGHSLLEEYYWRWFVFRGLQTRIKLASAVLISSLGFMAHHVLLLAQYFGWSSPATWVFSLAVAIGGAFWAWLYARSQSLLAPWLSHLLVDAAIFTIGFHIARDVLK